MAQKREKRTAPKRDKETVKKDVIAACVKLFLECGYSKTTLSQIAKEAGIGISSFQSLFGTKDGVLLRLTEIMFDSQFEAARGTGNSDLKPLFVYAAETSIQITMTELNENLRDIYVEAYSNSDSSEYIYKRTSAENKHIFEKYNPGLTAADFYELDIGSAGMMRGYMSKKCDQYFTLEKKLTKFLTMTLRAYNVPENEIKEAVGFVLSLDIRAISNQILHTLFENLAMQFDFELSDIEK